MTSNVSSLPEVAGDVALLIDPTDTESLQKALVCLVSGADLRAELTRRALVQARKFDWKFTAEETYRAYCKAAGESR